MIVRNVLIVEDVLGIARPLERALALSTDFLYKVTHCPAGEQALKKLRTAPFDLLITDLRLPGMDGLELLELARLIHPSIRSMMITAYGTPEIEERLRHTGTVYVPKPFHLRDVVRLAQRILSEAADSEPAAALEKPETPAEDQVSFIERRRATHFKVLACDFDGTLAHNDVVSTKTWEVLRQARIAGLTLMIATGRTLESILQQLPYLEYFEAVVAEDGAVIYYPRRDAVRLPFGRLSAALVQRLEEMKVPLERGMSIVATWVPHDQAVLDALQKLNVGVTIEYNRGAVMLLPPGATKGTGLSHALRELGFSARNLVVCGDAENDRSMFEVAELAVATPNSIPKIKAVADTVMPDSTADRGTGFETLVSELLTRRGPVYRPRPERRLVLGYAQDESPVYLDPVMLVDSRMGIFGASSSGKSWLAGLLTEELFKLGYQVCILDPEGDYRGLAFSIRSLLLGGTQSALPPIANVLNLIEWHDASIVLDLSPHYPEAWNAYVAELLHALAGLRARRGRPHWLLIDEIQRFCPPEGGEITDLLLESMQEGMGCGIVSYRPSQVSPTLLERLDHWLITRVGLPEELQALKSCLAPYQEYRDVFSQLDQLPLGQTYLYSNTYRPLTSRLQHPVRFQAGPRSVRHIRHLHKYLRAPLPEHKRFHFHTAYGSYLGYAAANLWEFREILSEAPLASIEYHLRRGDFERWLREVLRDEEVARQVQKLSRRRGLKGEPVRQALLEIVINRYEELDSLV